MTTADPDTQIEHETSLLLTTDEWPLKWQRRLHLVPREGMGLARRAILYALIAWAPLAIWAFLHGRAFPGGPVESLSAHFGVNVRCLIAIPLLILSGASGDIAGWRLRLPGPLLLVVGYGYGNCQKRMSPVPEFMWIPTVSYVHCWLV